MVSSATRILALAAIASVGAAGLVTSATSADARPGYRGGFGRFAHGPSFHRVHRHWYVKPRPWIGVGAFAAPAYAVAPRPPGPCARLAVEYGRQDPMAFMHRCMKESAARMSAAPPGDIPPDAIPPQQTEAPPRPGDAEPMPTK